MKDILMTLFMVPVGFMLLGEGYKHFENVCKMIWK